MTDWNHRKFLENLQGHLSLARARLHIYELLREARRDPETRDALQLGALFFKLAEDAFYLDAAMTVQKLYTRSTEDYGSLRKYLNKFQADYPRLVGVDPNRLPASKVDDQLARLSSHEETYTRLKDLRNNWLAHHGQGAFNDPVGYMRECAVTPSELRAMIDTAQQILSEHKQGIGSSFTPGLPRESDFLALLDVLLRYHEVQTSRYQNDHGESWAVRKMFHFEESKREHLRVKFVTRGRE